MKLLVITYSISKKSPAGQVFRAYLDSLSKFNGVEVTVISTPDEDINQLIRHVYIKNPIQVQERIHKLLFMATGFVLENFIWIFRAKRKIKSILTNKKFSCVVSFVNGNKPELVDLSRCFSVKYSIPLYVHMVDPIPPPSHWGLNPYYWDKLRRYVEAGLQDASLLSYGNKRMLEFQNSLHKSDFSKKSFVAPDAVSGRFTIHGQPNKGKKVFTYLGAFYGIRKPDNLFLGFSKFIQLGYNAELRIYGNSNIDINCYDLTQEVSNFIKILPFTSDLDTVIADSHVLVDVDVPFSGNVFSSSKIKRYLFHDRTIFCITNNDSPSFDICKCLPKTSVVSDHQVDNIVEALNKLYSFTYNVNDFKEREELINEFAADNVAKKIISELKIYDTK